MVVNLAVVSSDGSTAAHIIMAPRRVILGGYTARSGAERERHIAELREIGIEPPERVPAFWHVSPWLITTASSIEVQGHRTSGEIEYALIAHEGRTYVAAASDQTDREFERSSIPRSKQLCPKVVSQTVVPLEDVIDRWDEIILASDVSADGRTWRPYQRSPLAAMLGPRELVRAACGSEVPADGTILLSGTIPLIDGTTRYESHFRGTLTTPEGGIELELGYRVDVLPEIVTKEVAR